MPAAAWPGSVHRYAALPFFSVTTSTAVLPGRSMADFLPAILKSWVDFPLFVTLNVTTPAGTDIFESVNFSSDGLPAVTVTVDAFGAASADAASVRPATATPIVNLMRVNAPPRVVSGCGGRTARRRRPRGTTMPAVWGIEARLPHRVRGRRRLSTLALMAARRSHPAVSNRTRVRRLPERGVYNRGAIDAVLDAGLVAHLGFVHEDQPFVIPTLHARLGDRVYVHGSAASRTLRGLETGIPACLTVTLLDGIVLARSVFEHSMNYRSAVVLGTATPVDEPEEKLAALEAFTEKLLPGRWEEARQPTRKELKATSVLSMPLDEASAKIRDGHPEDGDTPDADLDVWAGYLPLVVQALEPVADPTLRPGIPVPPGLRPYRRPGLVT